MPVPPDATLAPLAANVGAGIAATAVAEFTPTNRPQKTAADKSFLKIIMQNLREYVLSAPMQISYRKSFSLNINPLQRNYDNKLQQP